MHYNTSMKDCFGLTQLYGYLNMPFLSLKVKALEESVAKVKEEMITYDKEYSVGGESQDYMAHLTLLRDTSGGSGQVAVPPQNLPTPAPVDHAQPEPSYEPPEVAPLLTL